MKYGRTCHQTQSGTPLFASLQYSGYSSYSPILQSNRVNIFLLCLYSCTAEVGGFCEGPGECRCRDGFSGNSCSISKYYSLLEAELAIVSKSSLQHVYPSDMLSIQCYPYKACVHLLFMCVYYIIHVCNNKKLLSLGNSYCQARLLDTHI